MRFSRALPLQICTMIGLASLLGACDDDGCSRFGCPDDLTVAFLLNPPEPVVWMVIDGNGQRFSVECDPERPYARPRCVAGGSLYVQEPVPPLTVTAMTSDGRFRGDLVIAADEFASRLAGNACECAGAEFTIEPERG